MHGRDGKCRASCDICFLFKCSGLIYHDLMNQHGSPARTDNPGREIHKTKEPIALELIALFRILVKAPPREHDTKTCPLCKDYGFHEIA
jgi:hypothetical protein